MGVVCAEIVFNEFQLLGRHQTYDAPTTPVRDHVRADILDNEARFRAGNEATKYERLAVRSPRGYDPLCDHFIVAWQNIDSSCNFSEVTEHFAPDKWQTYPERLTPRAPVGVRPTSPALVKLQGRVAPQRRPVRSARASSNANVFCSTFHPRLVPTQVLMPRTVSTCVELRHGLVGLSATSDSRSRRFWTPHLISGRSDQHSGDEAPSHRFAQTHSLGRREDGLRARTVKS